VDGEFYGGGKEILPPDILMRHTYKSAKATPLLTAVDKIGAK
jgi:hypothetical protein